MPQHRADDVHSDIQRLRPGLVDLRRHFHQYPETAYEERRTAQSIAGHLRGIGLEVAEAIADTGVVGLLRGGAAVRGDEPDRTLLIRADIDALPVTEETGLDYASRIPGKMHACGHDGHIAIALITAEVLA